MLVTIMLVLCKVVHGHVSLFDVNPGGCKINTGQKNDPVNDVTSKDILCGPNSLKINTKCAVKAGDDLKFEFGHEKKGDSTFSPGYKGPCDAWMAKLDGSDVPEKGWFKIWEHVGEGSNWCTNEMRTSNGVQKVPIPKEVPEGEYVVRLEIASLHEANRPKGVQFYMGCAAVKVSGGTGSLPSDTKSIPGYLKQDDPLVNFDVYTKKMSDFSNLGGPVASFGNGDQKDDDKKDDDKKDDGDQTNDGDDGDDGDKQDVKKDDKKGNKKVPKKHGKKDDDDDQEDEKKGHKKEPKNDDSKGVKKDGDDNGGKPDDKKGGKPDDKTDAKPDDKNDPNKSKVDPKKKVSRRR